MKTKTQLRGTSILTPLIGLTCLLGFCLVCNASHMDLELAKHLKELEKISTTIAQGQPLSKEQWLVIEKSFEPSEDNPVNDISSAVATLLLQKINTKESRESLAHLAEHGPKPGLLTQAVLKKEQVASGLVNASPQKCVETWKKTATDPNPHLRLAAAKALCAIDLKVAKETLTALEQENSEISTEANKLRRALAKHMNEEPPPPLISPDLTYGCYKTSTGTLDAVKFAKFAE